MDVKQCINITLTTVKYLFVGLCILGSGAYLAYALTLDLHKNVVLLKKPKHLSKLKYSTHVQI